MTSGPLIINMEEETLKNPYYRRVIQTGFYMQTVLMTLLPGEDIPLETHRGDQFVRVERGQGKVWLNGDEFDLEDGISVNIPAGVEHYFKNTGSEPLSLYSLYAPPEHSPYRTEYTQPDTRERIIVSE